VIKIVKVANGFEVSATPPHVKAAWHSSSALTHQALIAALLEQGAHQTDIGDALASADPDWLKR